MTLAPVRGHISGMDWAISTLLPLLTLGALGAAVPIALARRFPDTLAGLARAMALSVLVLVFVGAALFIVLYGDEGVPPSAAAAKPGALAHFLGLGLKSALVWGPVAALTGIGLGQGVEARRARRLAARDGD